MTGLPFFEVPAPRAPVAWSRVFATFRAPERELERIWRTLHASGVAPAEESFYRSESSTPGLFTLMGWMWVPTRQVARWREHPRRLVWHEESPAPLEPAASQAPPLAL